MIAGTAHLVAFTGLLLAAACVRLPPEVASEFEPARRGETSHFSATTSDAVPAAEARLPEQRTDSASKPGSESPPL